MQSKIRISAVLFLGIILSVNCETCKNPKVNAAFFTSQDATVVTQIAYITEFSLDCDNKLPENFALYAEVDGQSLNAAKIGDNKYQVSWTEEIQAAKTGVREVKVMDEDGWSALRRARRNNPNALVEPLVTIQLNHPGSYNGPWVNSEIMATIISILVAYIAISNKSKLLA